MNLFWTGISLIQTSQSKHSSLISDSVLGGGGGKQTQKKPHTFVFQARNNNCLSILYSCSALTGFPYCCQISGNMILVFLEGLNTSSEVLDYPEEEGQQLFFLTVLQEYWNFFSASDKMTSVLRLFSSHSREIRFHRKLSDR